ncbi:MAG: RNA polymerase sigma factor [Candidatus Acidiferrales bacterium]
MKSPENAESGDRQLVEAAQKDPRCFAELYERNLERVYAFVLKRVRHRQEAEDVTSEVFHQALANLPQFEWRGIPFHSWLYRIASNAMMDHWKRFANEAGNPRPEESGEPSNLELTGIEDRAALYRAVDELPTEQRRVVVLRFAEENSIREIAQKLRKTEGAVKQLQFRALEYLRERMGQTNG